MDGGEGNDTLVGVLGDIYGGNGNDMLDADYSDLYGGNGNDTLIANNAEITGGNGNDTITVNFGLNNVRFNAPTEGVDTITGFLVDDELSDTISVSASGFGGGLIAGDESTPYGPAIILEQFVLGTVAADASDRFIYNNTNGALFFDIDGTGTSEQVRFVTLVGAPGITNSNIFVDV